MIYLNRVKAFSPQLFYLGITLDSMLLQGERSDQLLPNSTETATKELVPVRGPRNLVLRISSSMSSITMAVRTNKVAFSNFFLKLINVFHILFSYLFPMSLSVPIFINFWHNFSIYLIVTNNFYAL